MELFPFLMKRLLRNLVTRQLRAIALCILLCIILHEICTPIYANGRFLALFFFTRNTNCHRHVDRFGDVPFISLVCNRPRSLKKYFPYNKQLGEKRETFTNTKTCKGTCGTCTLVSHSSQIFLKKLIGTDFFGQMISFTQPWRFSFSA